MNLTEKLKTFIGSSKNRLDKEVEKGKYFWIAEKIEGKIVKTPLGEHIEKEVIYDNKYEYSGVKLSEVLEIPINELDSVFKNLSKKIEIEKIAFLDTETTGLAGGSGTYAFLIGVGFFENNYFRLNQFFMPDYSEEPSLLLRLREILSGFEFVVTFNGKIYDVPLLNTRYVINKMNPPFHELCNLDLLIVSRRIFKKRLKSVALGNLERQLFYMERENDIPGFMIPAVYFNYLRTSRAEDLIPIFFHNQKDILSMVNLLYTIFDVVKNPLGSNLCRGEDYICIAKLYEEKGDFQKSIECYKKAIESENIKEEACIKLSLLYKKLKMWDEAVSMWMEMAEKNIGTLIALEELSKYFEHIEKNYDKAIKEVERALHILSLKKRLLNQPDDKKLLEFKKRLERLKDKRLKNKGQIFFNVKNI